MVRPRACSIGIEGIRASILTPSGEMQIESALIGRFNLYNILAAVSACLASGIDPVSIAAGIRRLKGVPGRLEKVEVNLPAPVLVDYAHSPDALFNVLDTLRPLTSGRIITVFGCGGDRDKGKRPQMGGIAARMSDVVVITSDNPRTEDPLSIARRIEEGVIEAGKRPFASCRPSAQPDSSSGRGFMMEIDRAAAIKKALGIAVSGDVVLIAGKGHEDYQIIGGVKRHFDDREAVLAAAGGLK
jgi:UDP-N-acetylmuramoyl-L-alanyl-D-glutamate--2,6-diaminopimelate ligase